ncbi:hypothetical protein UA08_09308 [Talaromyces atroroseus]|uniref:AB hydrolase-1 domain-containing protein n=1 Tax=Talaromyces atroroseus TaxID=1441469 RepID=A0A1Q5Q6F9_TALAT|nr:hypothetical protein UA08_09308 [Talaromyces atroroseus]OKL55429.1 hypothetical protein UA08_09308 [Talaromyces atroroseus]
MSLHQPVIFNSPSHPGRNVSYLHLNEGAAHTLLFCYGAADASLAVNVFQPFVESHPDLSVLCVDRWTQGDDVARSGQQLISELSEITLELLDFLHIQRFAIAAHSAGVYQLLDLARHAGAKRLTNLFFVCTHIPAPYTGSKLMEWMCTMPNSLFRMVTKLDSSLGDTWIASAFVGIFGKEEPEGDAENALVAPKARQRLVAQHIRTQFRDQKAARERLDIDYRIGYERFEGITNDTLMRLYKDCPIDPTWFTTNGDVFFGPESVHRMVEHLQKADWKIIVVPEGTHADIYFRVKVWEKMYTEIIAAKEGS